MANNESYVKLRRKVPKDLRIPLLKFRDRILSGPPLMKEDTDPERFLKIMPNYAVSFGPFAMVFTVEDHGDAVHEHLSISHVDRYPTWDELMQMRAIFFNDDASVVQIMPPCDEYVNISSHCFHLWHKREGMIITIRR